MLFETAKPIWGERLQEKKHINLGLYANIQKAYKDGFVRIATSGFYRLYVNGEFVYYGPIRTAHKHYRVDEIPIGHLLKEENHIAIEVVNYEMLSYYALKQPGFIQVEVVMDGSVVAFTDERKGSFSCYFLDHRIRKMQEYSLQRTIAEGYRLAPDSYGWTVGKPAGNAQSVTIQWTGNKKYLERELKLHTFPFVPDEVLVATGKVRRNDKIESDPNLFFHYRDIASEARGFSPEELEVKLSDEIVKLEYSDYQARQVTYTGNTVLGAGEFEIHSLTSEHTGFIVFDVNCSEKTVLYLLFDELLGSDGLVYPFRLACINALYFELEPGKYHFMSMEPVGYKYINYICTQGAVEITNPGMVEYANPYECIAKLDSENREEQKIFEAAWQTFRQNAADIFMDCPTRERAGWLCDSFFIGRAAQFFTGDTTMEKQFLENYILGFPDEHLPYGMLTQSYPSEAYHGSYIVNWAMWYIVELEDFIKRGGDSGLLGKARELVYAILAYLENIENEDGLLDRLPSWAFVEWSKANDFVQDINYPNNMVYSYILRVVGKLYGDTKTTEKGEQLKELIVKRSYNGTFFVDNDVYKDGVPVSSGETTETCQYHAFFFDIVTPDSHPELWRKLTTEFGPEREALGLYPDVYPSNAFTGNMMRLDILMRYGLYEQCREEVVGYFTEMANITGTLWEHMKPTNSCNHGFASYAGPLLYHSIGETKII